MTMAAKKAATKAKSIYSIHPVYAMEDSYRKNLLERTGKTVEQWAEVVKKKGPKTGKEQREWLKDEHGVTTNYAWWIIQVVDGTYVGAADYNPEKLVDDQYTGKKAVLRPIYDKMLEIGRHLGDDVRVCPCETMVPFYRNHVFGQLKASTNTRVDLGLALGDKPAKGRLIDTGGFKKKDRITHRIPLEKFEDIDAEVLKFLKEAYDRDAK
jgi:Domain of unknown function (DUF5655)/Domain of unknown function (DUF4287)